MKKFVVGMIVFAVVLLGAIIVSAVASSHQNSVAGVIAAHTAAAKSKTTTSKVVTASKVGDGTYVVGEDIQPGTYTTIVPQDTLNCYWSRMKDDTGDLTGIIANGNLAPGAHGRFTVKKTDGAVTLVGGCDWTKVTK